MTGFSASTQLRSPVQGSECSPFSGREQLLCLPHVSWVLWKTPNVLTEILDNLLVRRLRNAFLLFKIDTDGFLLVFVLPAAGLSAEACSELSSTSAGREPGVDGKLTDLTSEGGRQL